MHIAVNTRFLIKDKLEGIGRFTAETLKEIVRAHPEHQFHFLFDRPYDEQFLFSGNISPYVLAPPARHPFLWYAWFEFAVPRALQKIQPALFFSPDGYLSLSSDVPSVPVIHDLNFEHYPEDLPFLPRTYYRHFMPRFARKARRIATVSQYSSLDISQQYGITSEKIDVVYNGVNSAFHTCTPTQQSYTREKFSKGTPYFLYVGSLHARKNIPTLLRAYDRFRLQHPSSTKLVLAGNKMWSDTQIEETLSTLHHKEDVLFTGRVSDQDLQLLLGAALALTYVPYFEGFGIPIIEAMSAGTPVITSNVTSMPEIATNAALLVDPFSIEQIAVAMQNIHAHELLRQQLIEAGKQRAAQFTWKKTAERTWNCIEKALNHA